MTIYIWKFYLSSLFWLHIVLESRRKYIDKDIKKLSDIQLKLKVEDFIAEFLGIHINQNHQNGSINLTHTGLINQIIEALYIGHLLRKFALATVEPLVKYKEGDPPNGTYNYSSFIGIIKYLQVHSCPDVTYSVIPCARFVQLESWFYYISLYCIGQYLKGAL